MIDEKTKNTSSELQDSKIFTNTCTKTIDEMMTISEEQENKLLPNKEDKPKKVRYDSLFFIVFE